MPGVRPVGTEGGRAVSGLGIGTCPVCGHSFSLNKDWTLPRHMPDGRKNDGGDPNRPPRCEGSRQKPVGVIL